MKLEKLTHLSTSIFCKDRYWNSLINDAIKPFIYEMQCLEIVKSYSIAFSYSRGDNLRLTLYTQHNKKDILARKAGKFFSEYFVKSQFDSNRLNYRHESAFLSLESNAIYFGLYRQDFYYEYGKYKLLDSYIDFNVLFTQLLIEEIVDYEITNEVVLTFALYLHVALIHFLWSMDIESVLPIYCKEISNEINENNPMFSIEALTEIKDIYYSSDPDGWKKNGKQYAKTKLKKQLA